MANISQLSPLPFLGFTLVLPDSATVVQTSPAPFNNTNTVIFYNTSTVDRVFVQVADVTAGLPAAGTVTSLNSTIIPPGASISICIGTESQRHPMGTVAYWAANPGANLNIVVKAESGDDVPLNITYVQNQGGADGRLP